MKLKHEKAKKDHPNSEPKIELDPEIQALLDSSPVVLKTTSKKNRPKAEKTEV